MLEVSIAAVRAGIGPRVAVRRAAAEKGRDHVREGFAVGVDREAEAGRQRAQLLMTRRLVEAGVEIVTSELSGPLCGRVQNSDDHAVNHHVLDALRHRAPYFDRAVAALVEDICDRGFDKRVLVVVAGEFGRTPKIAYVASSGAGVASAAEGTVQPGRDHWPRANSMLFAGGGISAGRVIGATDRPPAETVANAIRDSRIGSFIGQ